MNFTQLAKIGDKCEKTFRELFKNKVEWISLNIHLANKYYADRKERSAIVIDHSYLSKSGKHTAHTGKFWSGVAGDVKYGLEILGIGFTALGYDRNCIILDVVQSPNSDELKAKGMNRVDWCLKSLSDRKDQLLSMDTNLILADAAFSGHPFVKGLKQLGFFIVSRLRKDAALYYPAEPKEDNSVGRPPTKGGRLDPKALDHSKALEITEEGWAKAYDLLVWCTSLKSQIRLAICYDDEGNHKYFFSNDLTLNGEEIVKLYRSRFQVEFCFRDAHQFTGLGDCQARSEEKLGFSFNVSMLAVNTAKVLIKKQKLDLSVGEFKTLISNLYFANRIFRMSGLDPDTLLFRPEFLQFLGFKSIAA